MKRSDGKKTPEERRARPRVHVMTEIGVSGTLGQQAARLLDPSRSGARFLTDEPSGARGDALEILLPARRGARRSA